MEEKTNERSSTNEVKIVPTILVFIVILALGIMFIYNPKNESVLTQSSQNIKATLSDGGHLLSLEEEKKILQEMISLGVIDENKIFQVTELNLLWALGLAHNNPILSKGPISDIRYGGPEKMASVGGWTISKGPVMDHYGKHKLITLDDSQQKIVEKVSKGIYRPCCDNSTYFPDCNHGMAMLGLLEYLASKGMTEEELWRIALVANRRWFPDQYRMIDLYLKQKGLDSKNIPARDILGYEYSSGTGFTKISSQVTQPQESKQVGCGV